MILSETGHVALSESMYAKDYMLAWGTMPDGQEWTTNPPTEDPSSTALNSEVGRIKPIAKEYVYLDNAGVLEIGGQKWTISIEPTKYIYFKFTFDQLQNSNDKIYQLGIFSDTVPVDGAASENYLLPTQITESGKMVMYENQVVLYRNTATRETYEYVITF